MSDAFELLVMEQLRKLNEGQDQLTAGLGELKGEIVAVGGTAERTLTQATKTNGRVDELEVTVGVLKGFHHDADLAAAARKQQRDEVRAKAFSILRALDNKFVTSLLLGALVALGWVAGRWSW